MSCPHYATQHTAAADAVVVFLINISQSVASEHPGWLMNNTMKQCDWLSEEAEKHAVCAACCRLLLMQQSMASRAGAGGRREFRQGWGIRAGYQWLSTVRGRSCDTTQLCVPGCLSQSLDKQWWHWGHTVANLPMAVLTEKEFSFFTSAFLFLWRKKTFYTMVVFRQINTELLEAACFIEWRNEWYWRTGFH